jgi:hypothetical protein
MLSTQTEESGWYRTPSDTQEDWGGREQEHSFCLKPNEKDPWSVDQGWCQDSLQPALQKVRPGELATYRKPLCESSWKRIDQARGGTTKIAIIIMLFMREGASLLWAIEAHAVRSQISLAVLQSNGRRETCTLTSSTTQITNLMLRQVQPKSTIRSSCRSNPSLSV